MGDNGRENGNYDNGLYSGYIIAGQPICFEQIRGLQFFGYPGQIWDHVATLNLNY